MPSTIFSGSVQPVTNTIHNIGTIGFSGVYVYKLDAGQMRAGDEIELRIADVVGPGTISCIYLASFSHQQSTQIKASPPFVIESGGGHVSIVQRAGSSRWFNYSVVNI